MNVSKRSENQRKEKEPGEEKEGSVDDSVDTKSFKERSIELDESLQKGPREQN